MASRRTRSSSWLFLWLLAAAGFWLWWRTARVADHRRQTARVISGMDATLFAAGLRDPDLLERTQQDLIRDRDRWVSGFRKVRLPAGVPSEPLFSALVRKGVSLAVRPERRVGPGGAQTFSFWKVDLPVWTLEVLPSSPAAAAQPGPRIVLVIDDLGYRLREADALVKLGIPLTFAVLPGLEHSEANARQLSAQGYRVILHQPMQIQGRKRSEGFQTRRQATSAELEQGMLEIPGVSGPSPTVKDYMLRVEMPEDRIRSLLDEALSTVPTAVGVSNHVGSGFTQNAPAMRKVLEYLRERGLPFFDSRTSTASVAYATARRMKVPTAQNQVFLDNRDDEAYIRAQLRIARKLALRGGTCIAIGHVGRRHIAGALRAEVPEFRQAGVEFAYLTDLLR